MGYGRARIKHALFESPRRKNKLKVSEKWYRRKRTTMNSKLRQAIIDILPFDVDKDKADVILWTIFDYLTERIITDERVTIPTFGYFQKRRMNARKIKDNIRHKVIYKPSYRKAVFYPCRGLKKLVYYPEGLDGNSGTD